MHRVDSGLCKEGLGVRCAGDTNALHDIPADFLSGERTGLAAQHDALPQLPQLRQFEFFLELGLAREDDLQQLVRRSLEIGQQANLFEYRKRQVLRFVYDQHGGFAGAVTVEQPLIELHELLALRAHVALNFKLRQDKIKQLIRIHPRIEEERGLGPAEVQPVEQTVYERGLSGSHLAGQRDESLSPLDTVHQSGERFLNWRCQQEVTRIGIDVERTFFQSKKALVHGLFGVSTSFSPVQSFLTTC